MKIYIIGAAGSGKSTLAGELSLKTGIIQTDLDDIFWDNNPDGYGNKRDDSVRDEMYQKILDRESWIIEGVYINWPRSGFHQSDILIFLDIDVKILNYRILKRFILRKLGIYKNKKKETLKGVRALIKWNRSQVGAIREHFSNEAAGYANLVHLRNNKEIRQFPASF